MDSKYLFPATYRMRVPGDLDGIEGSLIPASGLPRPTLERRDLSKYPALNQRIFDPQLYLSRLDGNAARNHCLKLASYGWFSADGLPEYQSGEGTQAEWRGAMRDSITDAWSGDYPVSANAIRSACSEAIRFQVELATAAVVLPVPLIVADNITLEREMRWVEAGLKSWESADTEAPLLATVAVSESALVNQTEWDSELVDAILDQYGSRGISGLYVVIESGTGISRELTSTRTCSWILELVWRAKQAGFEHVALNFCGTFGGIALAAGADQWCSGWYRSLRRLSITDLESSGGMAFPTYFSLPVLSDLDLKEDLGRLSGLGDLDDLLGFSTLAGEPLRATLRSGASVDDAFGWQYSRSNVQFAQQQYLEASLELTRVLVDEDRGVPRIKKAIAFVERARRLTDQFVERGVLSERSGTSHLAGWGRALNGLLAQH